MNCIICGKDLGTEQSSKKVYTPESIMQHFICSNACKAVYASMLESIKGEKDNAKRIKKVASKRW